MERDDVPYFMQANTGPVNNVTYQDESDLSTLVRVQKIFEESLEELKSINAFDLKDGALTVKEQIAAYQKAYDILTPIRDMVQTTVENVNQKYKEGRG